MRHSLESSYTSEEESQTHPLAATTAQQREQILNGRNCSKPMGISLSCAECHCHFIKGTIFWSKSNPSLWQVRGFFSCVCASINLQLWPRQDGAKAPGQGSGWCSHWSFIPGLFQIMALFYPPWFINSAGISSAKGVLNLTQTNSMGFQWCK